MTIRLGNFSRWNTSFELIACSMPSIFGISGRAPVAIRIFLVASDLPDASWTIFGPVRVARSRKISTEWLSSVEV
jgi:hypothetical protein